MISFAELLKSYIDQNHVTINEIAHYTRIDHSTLYKIVKGTRRPSSMQMVNSIAHFLRLSAKKRHDLQEAYYCSLLGESRYYGFQQITDLLGELRSPQPADPQLSMSPDDSLNSAERILSGTTEISSAIIALFREAASNGEKRISCFTAGSLTFYPSLFRQLLSLWPNIVLDHLIVLDESSHLSKEYRVYNLECFRSIFPLLIQYPNYHLRCIYADINTLQSIHPLLSEMVITGSGACVFRPDGTAGFLFHDNAKRSVYEDSFRKLESASSKFADYLSPELLLAAYQKNPFLSDLQTDHFLVRQITGLFNPGICSVLVLGQDDCTLIQKHLNLPEPQKTQFIHALNQYLPAQRNLLLNPDTAFPIISTRQGIEYFTSTGYINELNPSVMYPLNIGERIQILRKWYQVYEEHAFVLVDMPRLKYDSHSWVVKSWQSIILQVSTETGIYLAGQITEPNIVSLFNAYFSFITDEFAMDENDVRQFFDEQIKKLKRQNKQIC